MQSTIEHRDIERAVGTGRIPAAAASLARWYASECETYAKMKSVARRSIEANEGNVQETRQSLVEIEREEAELHAGWEHSSLRRHVLEVAKKGERHEPGGVEQRVGLVTPSGLLALPAEQRQQTRASDKRRTLVGYAAVFGIEAVVGGWFREKILPGAFSAAIQGNDIRCLYNHDANLLLGRNRAGTLRLYEDAHGLLYYCDLLSRDSLATGVARRIERGDVSGCSFSFSVKRDRWELAKNLDDLDLRIVEEVTLFDVGPVTYPCYIETSCSIEVSRQRAAAPARDIQAEPTTADDYFRDADEHLARYDRLAQLQARLGILAGPRRRDIERGYRKAERIINRCKQPVAR